MPTQDDIQGEIDTAVTAGNPPVIQLAAETYTINAPLDFTGCAPGATMVGLGQASFLDSVFDESTQFDEPLIDITGCDDVRFRDFRTEGGRPSSATSDELCAAAILCARNAANDECGGHIFERLYLRGRYKHACVSIVGVPKVTIRDCNLTNHEGPSQTINGVAHGGNLIAVCISDYGPTPWFSTSIGEGSPTSTLIDDCILTKTSVFPADDGGAGILIVAEDGSYMGSVTMRLSNTGVFNCVAEILIDIQGTTGTCERISVNGMRFEGTDTDYLVKVYSNLRALNNCTFREFYTNATIAALDLGDLADKIHVDDATILRNGGAGSGTLIVGNSVTNSTFERIQGISDWSGGLGP